MKAKVKEMVTVEQLANMIDHTNLKAFADDAAFEKLCDEAKKYNFKMVAINPAQTVRCKKKLEGSPVHVSFGNAYNGQLNGGASVVNRFTNEEGVWDWQQQTDSSADQN